MVGSGAGISVCPVDCAQEWEVKPGSVELLFAGGDRIEHIGQKTVGYATRVGVNVDIAFEAAKVRRPLLSVDSLVEKWQVAVFTDSGGFIIPRSALQVGQAVERLSRKRQNGHCWLPLARRIETSVNLVMVAPTEGEGEEQDVDEKMDEELPVEEWSERVVRKPVEPTPEQRSAHERERRELSQPGIGLASRINLLRLKRS